MSEDCAMWTMIGTKIYKKCAQVYKLEAENTKFKEEVKAGKELWVEAQTARKRLALENDKFKERIEELEFEVKGMERDINVRDSDIEDLKHELSKP